MDALLAVLLGLCAGGVVSTVALGLSVATKLGMKQRGTWPDGPGAGTAVTLDLVILAGGPIVAVLTAWLYMKGA